MPELKNPNERGDMIVHFKVDYPKTLTETQRNTMRKIFMPKIPLKREIFSENVVLRG
jgi:DnaJ-class molecular chaperone